MQLRPYQLEDVQKLMTRDSMGVFNEQRTGKTPTSIAVMEQRGVERLLIVCPASLVYAWKEEYKKWTGKDAYVITSATKFNQLDKTQIPSGTIIVNYENLRTAVNTLGAWEKLLKKYKPEGLIVDEVHRCKSRKSANFRAVKAFNKVPHRLYLSGTPAPNKPWDIWTTLHFIHPDYFKSYWKFAEEYFVVTNTYKGRQQVMEPQGFQVGKDKELQWLLNQLSVMRKRKDVMQWLPEIPAPTQIKLPCTPAQRKYIQALEDTFECEHINTDGVLTQLVRIRQICGAPEMLKLKGSSPKLTWLQEYIRDYPEKSIIVFSNSKKLLELAREKLNVGVKQIATITGETHPKDRKAFVDGFQSGEFKVILIQTQAGKEGLTLDKADATIFLDTYPPAADYSQAKDRMIATVPENVKPQEIIHVMMKDTYDERLYELVEKNISATEVINDYINHIERSKQHG